METWPVGLRFQPTEDELVDHHLRGKLKGKVEPCCLIPELYIYEFEPPDLFDSYNKLSAIPSDGRECFFFCPCGDNIPDNRRSNNRMTEYGYWKDTCKKRVIRSLDTGKQIGIRKILVYYEGRQPKGRKTDVVMHEYLLNSSVSDSKISGPLAFVLCHIIDRKRKKARSAKVSTSASLSNVSTPHDSGNGRPQEISAQASEEVMIETEDQSEMSISSIPDNNPHDSGNGRAHEISAQASEEVTIETEDQSEISISSIPDSNPHDSGNGRAHEISAQASEEVTMETEDQSEILISSIPDSNVPVIPQQAQMHEEQSLLSNGYLFVDGHCDEWYDRPYSPSDGIEILDLWDPGRTSMPKNLSYINI